jgi:hypothetical protein
MDLNRMGASNPLERRRDELLAKQQTNHGSKQPAPPSSALLLDELLAVLGLGLS